MSLGIFLNLSINYAFIICHFSSALPTPVRQVPEVRDCPVIKWVVVSQLISSMKTPNLKMTRKRLEETVQKYETF